MSTFSSALDLGGDILEGYGAYQQGEDNAGVAEYNAKIAQKNAGIVAAQGKEMARRALINGSKVIGAEEATYGAAGVGGVSAQAVLRNSAAQNELNSLTIKHNADIKSQAYLDEANLDRMKADNARKAADVGVASSALGFLGDVATIGALVI